MVEENATNNKKCTVKHFAIDEEHSYVEMSVTMPEEEHKRLISGDDA